jgi:hypothetical protein
MVIRAYRSRSFAGPFSTWELLTPIKDRLEALTMSLDLKGCHPGGLELLYEGLSLLGIVKQQQV